MIAAEAKNHFQSMAYHEMFDMQSTLDRVLNARHAEMVARMGGGVSGNLLAVLAEEGRNSLRARGRALLGHLLRCLSVHGVDLAENLAEAAGLLKEAISNEVLLIRNIVFGRPVFNSNFAGNAKRELEAQLSQEGRRLSQRLVTELELAAAASQNQQAGNGITFNVNGTVGLIQTGDGSQGTVSQHIDEGLKNEIASALSLLISLLDRPENASIGSRNELREVVLEAKAEAEKPSSNGLKLASSLRGIAEATKFVGSLEPAYAVLKPVLSHLGIYLP
jgi:hypothetical protein